MSAANNERASQGPLRVGVIATDDAAEMLISAVNACPLLELRAQAGMPQAAALPDVPWFDDARVLMSEQDVRAVVLATSARRDAELARTAAELGLHIWRSPPVARSFAEAVEVLREVRRLETVYRVASWWEHVADHAWAELDWPDGFEALFSELRISRPGPGLESWRWTAAEAAGGALACDGWALLEALVAVRGLPDSAMGAVANVRHEGGKVPRETEDTALAILAYANGGLASLRAGWDLPPREQQLLHHGRSATVALSDEEAIATDGAGTVRDRRPLPGDYLASELMRFAELVRGGARDRAAAPLERHLAVSALLETIYLSARTGHPESPRKLYEVQGWPVPRT